MGKFSDWKLKLRYGKLKTQFTHYTVIVECEVLEPHENLGSHGERGFFGLKVWAENEDEAAHLTMLVAKHYDLKVGKTFDVFKTDPVQPPGEQPSSYDANFTPYEIGS